MGMAARATAALHPPPFFEEAPQPDAPVEWWFLHGWFAGQEMDERCFMASVFRFEIPGAHGRQVSAFAALISVLCTRTGVQQSSSWLSHSALEAFSRPFIVPRSDSFSPEFLLTELRGWGLPGEFECPAAEPEVSAEALDIRWSGFSLTGGADSIVVAFRDPGTSERLAFQLTARTTRLAIDAAAEVGGAGESMSYVSYPNMRLEGRAGEREVAGDAWLDHQWGGYGWVWSMGEVAELRGWDWLGFRLDDGSEWVVMSHWSAESRKEFSRHLTMRDASGEVRATSAFDWTPVRWWTSPLSGVRHPVEWELRVRDWNVQLSFTPFADSQEMRVFGPLRAIWEGAGRVQGSVAGRPVEGPGRLEGLSGACSNS